MTLKDCFLVGKIVKKHSYKGEVVIRLDTDTPEAYIQMESLFVLRGGQLVPFFIERSQLNGDFLRVKFEGIDSEEQAEKLLKSPTYLPLDCLPELDEDEFYYHQIVGYRVVDAIKGEVGVVTGVNDNGAQALFEIDYNGVEIYIPVVDEFIEKLDKKSEILYLKTPEGLFDIFLQPDQDVDS